MGKGTMMAAGGMKAAKFLLTANSAFILFYFILGEHQFHFSLASQETFIGGACARQAQQDWEKVSLVIVE